VWGGYSHTQVGNHSPQGGVRTGEEMKQHDGDMAERITEAQKSDDLVI